MKNKTLKYITQAAIVAALYVVLSLLTIYFGPVQIRFSEALCILPYFMPAAVPGLFIGCILANIFMGCAVWDVIFGSVATLIGAIIASKIKNKYLLPLPNVIANTIIVPFIIMWVYTEESARTLPVFFGSMAGVLAGEIATSYILGILLFIPLEKHKNIFK